MSTKLTAERVRPTYEFIKTHRKPVQAADPVPGARRGAERVLRVAQETAIEPRPRGMPVCFVPCVVTASQGIFGAPPVFLGLT
jgi:hypothetical protein